MGDSLPAFLAYWPYGLVFAFFYALATVRGQATYWAGRVVTEQVLRRHRPTGGWRLRMHTWLEGGGADRGIDAVRRWGLVVIPVSYLTVGFQSLVLVGAGVLRIPWGRFTLVQVPGALAWATIYSTVGWAVWQVAMSAVTGSWVGLTVLGVMVAVVLVVRRRRRGLGPRSVELPAP